jgi:ferrochelatase
VRLKAALEAEGWSVIGIHDLPVLTKGNRNSRPSSRDAASPRANERGFTKLIAIGTSAYSSYSGCHNTAGLCGCAALATRLDGVVRSMEIRQFFTTTGGFTSRRSSGLRTGLTKVAAARSR